MKRGLAALTSHEMRCSFNQQSCFTGLSAHLVSWGELLPLHTPSRMELGGRLVLLLLPDVHDHLLRAVMQLLRLKRCRQIRCTFEATIGIGG